MFGTWRPYVSPLRPGSGMLMHGSIGLHSVVLQWPTQLMPSNIRHPLRTAVGWFPVPSVPALAAPKVKVRIAHWLVDSRMQLNESDLPSRGDAVSGPFCGWIQSQVAFLKWVYSSAWVSVWMFVHPLHVNGYGSMYCCHDRLADVRTIDCTLEIHLICDRSTYPMLRSAAKGAWLFCSVRTVSVVKDCAILYYT